MQKLLKNSKHLIKEWMTGLRLILLLCWPLVGLEISSQAQLSLDVANFGAKGDCAQIWVSTVSNSTVVTCSSNIFTTADIGKTIELFAVGKMNTGLNVNNVRVTAPQDLIAIITDVVNENTINIAGDIPQVSADGVYCMYGTDNSSSFQAAVNAATGPDTIINIPAGNFLLIPAIQYTNYNSDALNWIPLSAGILINKGGLHFIGASRDATILTAAGAFKFQGSRYNRGMVFIANGPITNNYPLIWDKLTFDGGVQVGLVGNQGAQWNNTVDGLGWDGTCAAGADVGAEPLHTFKEFINCKFQRFRGEMIKGITGSARNETILVTNCFFLDGNATAFNYNFAHTIIGCTFSNMYQIEEFYLQYPTNAGSYFVNNYATNIYHNFISLNGGTHSNMPYVISNNVFYQMGGNGIGTTPACNLTIISNQFNCVPGFYSVNIVLGMAGYQGWSDNSNIVITANNFTGQPAMLLQIAGGTSSTDPNRVESVQFYGNTVTRNDGAVIILQGYNWMKNVRFFSNDFSGCAIGATFYSGNYGSQYAWVDTNNLYYSWLFTDSGGSHGISYGSGSRYLLTYPYSNGTQYYLSDTDAGQIPAGAQMVFSNGTFNSQPVPIYTGSAKTQSVTVKSREVVTFFWNGSQWTTNAAVANFNTLTVNYGSGSGAYVSGQVVAVTASNFTGKVFTKWTGATNILANPLAASTTAIMPASGAHITANFIPAPPFNLRPLN